MNFIIAVLATWRLTEIFTQDRITEKLRKKFPLYLWTCSRCLSIWAGIIVTFIYLYFPFINIPFAISELYILFGTVLNFLSIFSPDYGTKVTLRIDNADNLRIESNNLPIEKVSLYLNKAATLLRSK